MSNKELLDGAYRGDLGRMRKALQDGADVNAQTLGLFRANAFHYACENGHLEAVELLSVVRGIDLNAVNDNDNTPFMIACIQGDLQVVQFVANLPGVDVLAAPRATNALHRACRNGRGDAIAVFLLDSNFGFDVDARDSCGRTALMLACYNGKLDTVKCLLTEHNADVKAVDIEGNSCLHLPVDSVQKEVVEERQDDIVQYLLRNHPPAADLLYSTNNHGMTAFDKAAWLDNQMMANYILTVAYKNHLLQQHGDRVIHAILEAAQYRYVALEEGVESEGDESEEEQDDEEESVQQQQQQTVKLKLPIGTLSVEQFRNLLFALGRRLLYQHDGTEARQLPMHVACHTNAPVQIVRTLAEQRPRSIRALDATSSTPLFLACQANAPLNVLQYLVGQYRDALLVRDSDGSIPLHAACRVLGAPLQKVQYIAEAPIIGFDSFSVTDHDGFLPLHALCESLPTLDVVQYVLEQSPQALETRTAAGDLPVMVACESHASEEVIFFLLRRNPGVLINFNTVRQPTRPR